MVNATGVWADRIRPDELYGEEEVPRIRPSRGTHVIAAARDAAASRPGVIVPAGGGRTVFVLPWLGRTLVGTTDNDYEGAPRPRARLGRRRGLPARRRERVLRQLDLGAGDLRGAYAGVRPLISTGDPKKSVDISRKAELYETSSGLVTITGGKLTTWRRMAKLAVDRLVEREGREAPCRTHEIPLGHADRRGRAARRSTGVDEDSRAPPRRAATATPRARCWSWRPRTRGWPSGSRPTCPIWWPRRPFAARHEQALHARPTCCCGARALGLLAARELVAPGADGAARGGPRRWRRRARLGRRSGSSRSWRDWREGWRPPRGCAGAALSARPRLRRRRERRSSSRGRVSTRRAAADGHRERDARLVLGRRSARRPRRAGRARAQQLADEGAELIDVGGESGRTDRPVVPVEEELARVVPLVERLAADGVLVSVDTWTRPVARAALESRRGDDQRRERPARPRARRRLRRRRARALVVIHTRARPKAEDLSRTTTTWSPTCSRFLRERMA